MDIDMNQRKTPAVTETIQKLRALIQGHSSARLPSVRVLAQRCAVSPVTILRAIAILKNEGLLEGGWGRGNFIASRKAAIEQNDVCQSTTAVEKTVQMIKNDIIEGKYRTHLPLPSIKNLTAQYRVSYPTVKKALVLLTEESILKQSGVRYHFFTKTVRPASRIAIVAFGLGRNSIKIETERERNFYQLLCAVAKDQNVVLETICCNDYNEATPFYTPDNTPLAEYLKHKNITGIILSSYHMKDSAACLGRLLKFDLPISAWVEDHRILKMIGRYSPERKKLSFFDTSYSTIPGYEIGRYLIEKGHKHIAYFSPFHKSPWSQNRLNGLKKAAASGHDVRIVPFVSTEYLNDYFILEKVLDESLFDKHCSVVSIEEQVHPFLKSRVDSVRYAHDILLRDSMIFSICAGFLKEASEHRSISAYVCANDHISALINDYWDFCALPPSRRPFLIGFDNSIESFRRNISSYEFNTQGEIQQMLNHLVYPNSSYQLNRKPAFRLSGRVVERS
jgi:DNA-binding transcriptional regulator YhcF (GntR family)